jgi:hypothetical protein
MLRHYFKVKPRLGDFKLERRVKLGDDVLALFSPLPAGETGGADDDAGAAPARKKTRRRLPGGGTVA